MTRTCASASARRTRLAAIALLAPPPDRTRRENDVLRRAKLVAAAIRTAVEPLVPGHIARYDDTFNPRAFGNLMQSWGTSTVLIESGGWQNNPEKQIPAQGQPRRNHHGARSHRQRRLRTRRHRRVRVAAQERPRGQRPARARRHGGHPRTAALPRRPRRQLRRAAQAHRRPHRRDRRPGEIAAPRSRSMRVGCSSTRRVPRSRRARRRAVDSGGGASIVHAAAGWRKRTRW